MREQRRKRSITFLIVLGCILLLTWLLPLRSLTPLQKILVTLTFPVENLFAWSAFELREWGNFWRSIRELKGENERLHEEVLTLTAQQAGAIHLEEENTMLRQELGLVKEKIRTLVAAEVIARDQSGLSTLVRINRGERQGIKAGLPVVVQGHILVGRVDSVTPFSAEVRLLSHTDSLVAAIVEGVKGEAIVRGDHGTGLLLDLARPNEKIAQGARVVTAGIGDGLPQGLFIGTIDTVRLSGDQLFQQASVVPPVRADTLRFMSVIIE